MKATRRNFLQSTAASLSVAATIEDYDKREKKKLSSGLSVEREAELLKLWKAKK